MPVALPHIPTAPQPFANSVERHRICDVGRCPRLHVVAGKLDNNVNPMAAEETFLNNIVWAADKGRSWVSKS